MKQTKNSHYESEKISAVTDFQVMFSVNQGWNSLKLQLGNVLILLFLC